MKKNSINSQTFYNTLSTTVLSGISFITLPIFTNLLNTEQYGRYSIFTTWLSILLPIMCLQSYTCLSVARYDYHDSYSEFKRNNMILGTVSCALFTIVGIIFKDPISKLLNFPSSIIIVMFVYAFANYVISLLQTIFTYEKKAEYNFYISLFLAIVTSILSYYLITKIEFNNLYEGRIYGMFIPYIIIALIIWPILFIKNKGKIKFSYWKYSIAYGIPIVFHLIFHEVLSQSNKLMLEYMGYAGATVGIFSLFQTITSVLSIIVNALNSSWVPFYFDDLNENAKERLSSKIKNYVELVTVLFIGFLLLSREVCYILSNESYMQGIDIIPLLVIPIFLMYMYQFPVNFEYFCKKTKMISVGTICSGIVNIVANYFLIPKYGMYGSCFSTIISYFVLFIVHFVIAKNIKDKKFDISLKDFILPLFFIGISIMCFYFLKDLWVVRWVAGAAIGIYELIKVIKRKTIF